MNRTEYLRTLSWEHHDGLVVAFRLQQGLNKNADPATMRDYILHTWESALDHHFWQEEEVLVPELETSKNGRDLLRRLTDDHAYFRELIDRMDKKKKPDLKYIQDFADRLNRHIRYEERELFPFLEENLAPDRLESIGQFLNDNHEKPNKNWSDTFWETKH